MTDRRLARDTLQVNDNPVTIYRLERLQDAGLGQLERLPFSIRVLLENVVRHWDNVIVGEQTVRALAEWQPRSDQENELPFFPSRVVLQDFTGVPAVVDLAAMRSAMSRLGGDPSKINPIVPADLVIDHSVQVDFFGSDEAYQRNVALEFERNRERYALLRWAQTAFRNFSVVPPGTGIVHQVNLEYLARVVDRRELEGTLTAFPDTLVGTDSHTTMINGIGVLGWGVGGIEAEAVMLGQPYSMLVPEVVGCRLVGELPPGATATDLVLTVTQMLRQFGVVGKFVEYFGPGLTSLTLPDRATLANMAPEYGATTGFFPVDAQTLSYLRNTGRSDEQIELVERYCKEQGLFRTDGTPDPTYSAVLELNLSAVEPSLAGPRRPQDRVALGEMKTAFQRARTEAFGKPEDRTEIPLELDGTQVRLADGSVVIAAITSCTNTSNPSVMLGAGLLAKKAVEKGLASKPWVKTSMAPGSRVVTDYLQGSGLLPYLETLGFQVVGYGCTTCIGNSGPLPPPVEQAIKEHDLVVAAVLSGNRNFEARVHPAVRANYLASPLLVVAYALAGRVDVDLVNEPLTVDANGEPVYLRDLWPTAAEVQATVASALRPDLYRTRYAEVFLGDQQWQNLPTPQGDHYTWEATSTYIQEPPFFQNLPLEPSELQDIHGARVLAVLGDSVTTDHISPAGSIAPDGPAGRYLTAQGVERTDFNTYGSRRGNHQVMIRGTFANVRIRNLLVEGKEGGWTVHLPTGEVTTIYDASMRYQTEGVPLLVIAGKEYGTGSSRDWAAKGTALLGIKAVLAESYERIHRSNLVGMGVLPLQFLPGETRLSLGLTGREIYSVVGLARLQPRAQVQVRARHEDGGETVFTALARVDSPVEMNYYRHGGILPLVLRKMLKESSLSAGGHPRG